jgi:hypothetical protein
MSKQRAISRQRRLKATQYIRYMRRQAMASMLYVAEGMSDIGWEELSEKAGLNIPSIETRVLILRRLRKLYK